MDTVERLAVFIDLIILILSQQIIFPETLAEAEPRSAEEHL